VSDPLDITHLIAAKVAAVKGTVARSNLIAVRAKEDLDQHQRWFERHRVLAAEDLKRHQRRLRRRRAIRACEQTAISLVLFVPSICVALFHGAIWVLIGLGTLLSITGFWIDAKAYAFGVWLVGVLSMCCSWSGAKARDLGLWLAGGLSMCCSWSGAKVRDFGLWLSGGLSLGYAWGGERCRAFGLWLEEIIGRQVSQGLVRLGFGDEALDGTRDAIRASHLDEHRLQEADFVRLRGDHERLQNRIHALDKVYGRRGAGGGRAASVSNNEWAQLRELARNARRLFEMQERGLLNPAVSRAIGRSGVVNETGPLVPSHLLTSGQAVDGAPALLRARQPLGRAKLWPARSVG
jgi:hypothetical protein